jgi:hypothetical protein
MMALPAQIAPVVDRGIELPLSLPFSSSAYAPPTKVFELADECCVAQGNCATIANYLERELRYMDAGERGSKRLKPEPQGTPGYL